MQRKMLFSKYFHIPIFLKNDFNYDKVKAGVIPLRTFKNDFIPASIKINSREKDALGNKTKYFK